jgi:U6 snRNA-associated Sm-like protein LSm8
MATFVEKLIDKPVNIITNDGRNFTGLLVSFDQKTNLILQNCVERVWVSAGKEVKADELGVYFIRGDNVAVIGEIEPKIEEGIDYTQVKGAPIRPMQIH